MPVDGADVSDVGLVNGRWIGRTLLEFQGTVGS